jgi:hypothetical protein
MFNIEQPPTDIPDERLSGEIGALSGPALA